MRLPRAMPDDTGVTLSSHPHDSLLYTSHFTPSFCDSDLNRVRALNNESQCDHTAHVVIDIVTTEKALGPAAREAISSGVHFCHVLCREVDSIQPTDHAIVGITLLL